MSSPSIAERQGHPWIRRLMRYGFPIFFPVAVACSTAVATASDGATKLFWTLTAIAATAGSAVIAVLKERQAWAAGQAAAQARAQLAASLNRAGAPLLTALGNVTTAKTAEDCQGAVEVLTTLVVDIAHSQCGRHRRPGATLRSVYYSYDNDRLERRKWAGRQDNTAPRKLFQSGASLHETEVVRFVNSEEVIMVDDLYYDKPPHFTDSRGRSYRSFIAVPVRAGETSFGMLTLDSDLAGSLTAADKGHLILLAGVLAAGLAHQANLANAIMPPRPRTPIEADDHSPRQTAEG